jgi:hypothetical protein
LQACPLFQFQKELIVVPGLATHRVANSTEWRSGRHGQFSRSCVGKTRRTGFSTQRVDFFCPPFFFLLIGYTVCDQSRMLLPNRMFQISNALRSKFPSSTIQSCQSNRQACFPEAEILFTQFLATSFWHLGQGTLVSRLNFRALAFLCTFCTNVPFSVQVFHLLHHAGFARRFHNGPFSSQA